jgi:hypothetical protein
MLSMFLLSTLKFLSKTVAEKFCKVKKFSSLLPNFSATFFSKFFEAFSSKLISFFEQFPSKSSVYQFNVVSLNPSQPPSLGAFVFQPPLWCFSKASAKLDTFPFPSKFYRKKFML